VRAEKDGTGPGSGLQEVEEKRAEANIAHRIVQLLLRELYDVHSAQEQLPMTLFMALS
jgi:hypothetical protein